MRRRRALGLRELWICRRGTAAVEFALVALPLIWVLGVIFETGAFVIMQFQLQFAAERAARLLRTNQISTTSNAEQFKTRLCEKLTLRNCVQVVHVDVRHARSFAQLNPPSVVAIGPARAGDVYTDTYDPGSNGDAGSLFVTYDWKFTFPFMGTEFGFGNVPRRTDVRRLYGSTIYMNELP